jgi:eukaryotic-like serine/threonine-protein kinase
MVDHSQQWKVMATNNAREATAKPGDVIEGRYRIIKSIGEGGMGTVYLAEHTLIKRRVAVKILHPEFANDATVIERFMNEARAAGTLGHPNIVESTDMGFTDDRVPYIVFEYLEGSLLTDEIYRLGGLPVRRAVRIAQKMASALHAAHAAGIVHRDLKSDNIFLTDKDEALDHVKVLDFGISRFLEVDDEQTRRGMIMGTPEFMAPEQITAPDTVDARADIYALGVILYEMLSAKRPFQNDDPRTLLHRIVHNEPPMLEREDAPRGLIELVMKLLQKSPTARLASMLDVETALNNFATQSDAKPARRRTGMVGVPESADTQIDLARISRPSLVKAPALDSPWPSPQMTTLGGAAGVVSMPPPGQSTRRTMGLIAAGLALGVGGLAVGLMRGGSNDKATPVVAAAAPMAAPAPAPLPAATAAAPQEHKVAMRVDSDVAGSRVTFRRRVAATPSKTEITATDIVEMVEVSAPGHKTVRYWLTVDRPTNLLAKLPTGSGLMEATEEQTLIAMGELADTANQVAEIPVAPALLLCPKKNQLPLR